jgi:uncharacterized tellurite resistance protein B-like protein
VALGNAFNRCPTDNGATFRAPTRSELDGPENAARLTRDLAALRARGLIGVVTLGRVATRTLDALSGAVKTLATLTFTDRQRLLEACATAAAHDGRISVDEYLVIRSVADALDVPMPALI